MSVGGGRGEAADPGGEMLEVESEPRCKMKTFQPEMENEIISPLQCRGGGGAS